MKSKVAKLRRWFVLFVIIFSISYTATDILLGVLLQASRPPFTCLLQIGTWERGVCRYKTSDSSKVCRSSLDCESKCVTEEHFSLGEAAEGVCYGWSTPRFCLNIIDYGILIERRCFD